MSKITCGQKVGIIIPSICVLIGVGLIIISVSVLPSVLKSSIEDQLKMGDDTYEYWGQSPGKTKSVTKRNFTFFNFTNPREFLYQNQTPVFKAINGYLLQQRFNFTDYYYSEDKSQVYFNDWLYFTQLPETRNIDEKLTVMNIGPLGFWYQIEGVGMPTFALQGFGGLFVELNQTFKLQAIGQGVSSQFLPNYTNWKLVCNNYQIQQAQCQNSWSDPQNGLSDQNNFQTWIQASYLNDNNAQEYLKSYFGFTDLQMQSIKQTFDDWASSLNDILNNWYCNGQECSSYDLTLVQLSSGEVTSNPPSGDAVDSICDTGNVTCIGQPQISKFLKNQFKKKYPDEKYQNLKFSTDTFKTLFTPYEGTLLNIGNLTDLFELGYGYDQSTDAVRKAGLLALIKSITNAQTKDHAFLIWQWVKYFTSQFVLKLSKGGSQKNSGMGAVFSQALYESFTEFGNWISRQYTNILGQQMIQNCQNFVKQTIQNINDAKVQSICSVLKQKEAGYYNLLSPCVNTQTNKQLFRTKHNLNLKQFGQYCDTEQKSFYTVVSQVNKKIFQHYGCSQNKGIQACSAYELSMKQFINSSITMNPIPNSIKNYEPALTGKKWNADGLEQFQYKNYLKEYYNNQNLDNQTFKSDELIDLLSFDKLFSASMVMEMMLDNDKAHFQKLYYWKNMTLLKNYVKFVTVQIGFGGFVQKRSPRQLLFGYEDPFLSTLKNQDTMVGGDPSINPIIMVNEPNITQQEAQLFPQSVYTGFSDIQLTRQYSSIFGKPYIAYNKTWYDGYEVRNVFTSPYKSDVALKGSDAIQNPPGLNDSSSIYCFITNIYRYAKLNFDSHTSMFDVDLLKFTVDKAFLESSSTNPGNQVYYQSFEGFHNMSFLGVPLQISKNNLYSTPANWSQLIKVYSENGQYEVKSSINDDTVLKVQPNTGALFFATVRLQTNYHYQGDILFGPSQRMLPITNVIRQGQISQETVNELFADLKTALKLQPILLILGIVMIAISIGVIIFFLIRIRKHKKASQNSDPLLVNTQSISSIQSGPSNGSSVNINKSLLGTINQK